MELAAALQDAAVMGGHVFMAGLLERLSCVIGVDSHFADFGAKVSC